MNEFERPGQFDFERAQTNNPIPERASDSVILSSMTPDSYRKGIEESMAHGGDYGFMMMGEVKSEIPQFIMEMAGGIEEARAIFDESSSERKLVDPEGTLILLERNIPSTAEIETKRSEALEVSVKGMIRRLFVYTDKTHDNLPVAVSLTDKFVDDLYDYIKAKEKAA